MRPAEQPDIVDQEIALRERVRNLELKAETTTLRPWRWVPNKSQANVIAEHSMLMGVPQFQIYTRYSRHAKYIDMAPSWPARRLAEIERAEGVYPVDLAKEFMAFRQELGVYPPRGSFRVFTQDPFWNWNTMGLQGRFGEVDYPDVGGPYRPTDFNAAEFRWWNHKLIHLAGPPTDPGARWNFYVQGTKPESGNSEGVDLTRSQTAPQLTEDSYLYNDGINGTFSYGDRNSYWQPHPAGPPPIGGWPHIDCGDPWAIDPPGFRAYGLDPAHIPGKRVSWFLSIGYYCPTNTSFAAGYHLARDGTGGNLHYISVPADSVYIDRPPVPWRGQKTWPPRGGDSGTDFLQMPQVDPFEGALAQGDQMAMRVRAAFKGGRYPLVQHWYRHRLPIKEPRSARYWHRARVIPPWYGMVEVKIAGTCKVQIRGSVGIDMTTIGWENRDTPVFALPEGIDVPNENGMVIARVTLADGSSRLAPFQLLHGGIAHRPDGSEIPSPPGYLHVYRKANWFAGNFITASNMPITVDFYGASFNCWPPPKSK